ncbi:MAG: 3-oxoacid CoA-transferase subunit A [Deltaproteobacteria bacterium]|nr:3-oxoacid CoA-transferase subunit A [Deltaproteobacteria bacterium]MBI3388778.1 3-oxoacid CoA-transferase subunit A [Deltaproteobacteria bacterium]
MARKHICDSAHEAVADIGDGASILVHSFGPPQAWPTDCLLALAERGVKDLTVICNTPAGGPTSLNILADKKQIRKLICSYVGSPSMPTAISEMVKAGEIELEMVPQGTLAERVRAGGAGLAGFFTPTGVGTKMADGKEERVFNGKRYLFERALTADFALLQAYQADAAGNLTYRRGMRNFGPAFATGGRTTIAEVKEIVPLGAIDPEAVITPGIFVDRIVKTTTHLDIGVLRQILLAVGRVNDMDGRALRDGGPAGLPADLMAMKAAALLREGEYVNLGIGLPTLVSNYIAERNVTLHSENGILAYGGFPAEGEEDIDLYNASGQLVTPLAGTAYFDSTTSFAMARSGRVSTIILGAFEVAQNGDLANWSTPRGSGGIGGAMDLAAGGGRIIAICYHCERNGRSKLVETLSYPATGLGCVKSVITDLAWIDVGADGFLLREFAPGLTIDDVKAATAAPLRVASDVREMQFG